MSIIDRLLGRPKNSSLIERQLVLAVRKNIDLQHGIDGHWAPRKPLYQKWKSRGRWFIKPSPFNDLPLLKRTKALYKSISARVRMTGSGWQIVISGEDYGIYQDRGFSTTGPNFVPLTPTGAKGGGKRGKDYFIAKNGVTVPSRAFLDPTPDSVMDIAKLITRDVAERHVQNVVLRALQQKGSVTWQRQYR